MALRDELERALHASWNTGDLAVYADHLQLLGDPRGELIALDLAPREDGPWRERRHAVLEAWLGPELAASAGRLVQHGVIHELRDGHHPPGLLEGPLGAVVRGFSTRSGGYLGPPAAATLHALERLAAHPRPWLTRLAIDYAGDTWCDPALRDRLIAATPNLVELYTVGARVFDSFRHPSLRRIYATPSFLRRGSSPNALGVPDTNADVIEISHHGYASSSFAKEHDLAAVTTLLEAIESTADCNELYASYGDLVQEHDSMPAVLMRLDEAGLVALEGPFARLTALGRGLLRWPIVRDRSPPRVPPYDSSHYNWDLWASDADASSYDRRSVMVGRMRPHCALLAACLERMPLEEAAYELIRAYLAFVCDVVAAGVSTDVALGLDARALAAVLRSLLVFHRLAEYHLECFDDVGRDDHYDTWAHLEQLVRFLESVPATRHRAVFRVVPRY